MQWTIFISKDEWNFCMLLFRSKLWKALLVSKLWDKFEVSFLALVWTLHFFLLFELISALFAINISCCDFQFNVCFLTLLNLFYVCLLMILNTIFACFIRFLTTLFVCFIILRIGFFLNKNFQNLILSR